MNDSGISLAFDLPMIVDGETKHENSEQTRNGAFGGIPFMLEY